MATRAHKPYLNLHRAKFDWADGSVMRQLCCQCCSIINLVLVDYTTSLPSDIFGTRAPFVFHVNIGAKNYVRAMESFNKLGAPH